jgi:hypothetical protein
MLDAVRVNLLQSGHLRLYTTNHAPDLEDTLATYTAIEAAFGGYASILCNAWAAAALNASDDAETDEIVRVFTATGAGLPVTVYGVFYVDVNGALAYAELFQNSVTLNIAGNTVAYQPVFTARSRP